MRCANPVTVGQQIFPCGQCMHCRIDRRRRWTTRLMLEARQHDESSFVTLTYRDEETPKDNSLHPPHLRYFLDRLRKTIKPAKVRYFAVGEYGEKTQRPHYHLALFGYPGCAFHNTRRSEGCCLSCDTIHRTWGKGHIFIGELNRQSMQYICGYVTKGLKRGHRDLGDRHPEFSRQSRRPGIGREAASQIAHVLDAYGSEGTGQIHVEGQHWPLDRYMNRAIRKDRGLDEGAPLSVMARMYASQQHLRDAAWEPELGYMSPKRLRHATLQDGHQKRVNEKARINVRKKNRETI